MKSSTIYIAVHFDQVRKPMGQEFLRAVEQFIEERGGAMEAATEDATLSQFTIAKDQGIEDAVVLELPVAITRKDEEQEYLDALAPFLSGNEGRNIQGAKVIGVTASAGAPTRDVLNLPEHLIQFEQQGIAYLRRTMRGDGLIPIQAKVKLKEITKFKTENPARYRVVLEANYRASLTPPLDREAAPAPATGV